jgi:cysteinyl-tRNA synthetase
MKLHNTLSRSIEELKPIKPNVIGLYTCGPTVYNFAHIGNLRTYIFEDLLRRTLEYSGYEVRQAMNITDVGHLTSDGDEGEDKMDKGAKREGKHPLEIARQYEERFFQDIEELNIEKPHEVLRATETIAEQIEIIKILEEKGFTYTDEFAVYFDTSKLPDYGKLAGQKLEDKKVGAREDVIVDIKKRNPQDFVLWFFLKGRYADHILRWPSPWGEGFPGWHIECSAISRKLLGQPFDIHTGGVDHIGTHHTNEIAQSEAAFGLPLANIWMHGDFLLVDSGRMGKSEGNFLTLDTVKQKGFSPLAYRYLCLTAHYRSQLNFTWESLEASGKALDKLYSFCRSNSEKSGQVIKDYEQRFSDAISNDLNIPQALAVTWEMINDKSYGEGDKMSSLLKFDEVLGLGLANPPAKIEIEIPAEIQELLTQREQAREQKDFAESDRLRDEIKNRGYGILDTDSGPKLERV